MLPPLALLTRFSPQGTHYYCRCLLPAHVYAAREPARAGAYAAARAAKMFQRFIYALLRAITTMPLRVYLMPA